MSDPASSTGVDATTAGVSTTTLDPSAGSTSTGTDALAGMAARETLLAPGNQIVDLAPLSALKALRSLELHDNEIVSLTPLAGTTALQVLGVGEHPLAGLCDKQNFISWDQGTCEPDAPMCQLGDP